MTNDHCDDEDEDGDDDDDEGDDDDDDDDDDDGVDDNDENDVKHNAHVFSFYKLCVCLDTKSSTCFALLKGAHVLVKFKKKFPPNDKAEPPPMLSWNSYAYVSALYFASDSTCLCLGV